MIAKIPRGVLLDTLKAALLTTSKDAAYASVYFQFAAGRGYRLASTDDFRLTILDVGVAGVEMDATLTIDFEGVKEVVKFIRTAKKPDRDHIVSIVECPTGLAFELGIDEVVAPLSDKPFVDFRKALPVRTDGPAVAQGFNPKHLEAAAKAAGIIGAPRLEMYPIVDTLAPIRMNFEGRVDSAGVWGIVVIGPREEISQ